MRGCDRGGYIGEAPDKEEFCMAYRAQKLSDQHECPIIMELKEHLKSNEHDTHIKSIIETSLKHFVGGKMGGGKGSCGMMKKGRMGRNDVPTIWRKHKGNIVKGSFCEMEGEWYWKKVATCGCKSCDVTEFDDGMDDY